MVFESQERALEKWKSRQTASDILQKSRPCSIVDQSTQDHAKRRPKGSVRGPMSALRRPRRHPGETPKPNESIVSTLLTDSRIPTRVKTLYSHMRRQEHHNICRKSSKTSGLRMLKVVISLRTSFKKLAGDCKFKEWPVPRLDRDRAPALGWRAPTGLPPRPQKNAGGTTRGSADDTGRRNDQTEIDRRWTF